MAASVQDALIAADGESRIVFWSPSATRVFGFTEAEAIGRPLTMLMPERFRAAHVAGIERVRSGGEAHVIGGPPVELVGLRSDGVEFPIELTLGRWEDDGATCFTGVVRDVSERHRAARVLTTQYEVAAALAASQDLEEGIVGALGAIGRGMGWQAGHMWVVDEAASVLRCRAAWHENEELIGFRDTSTSMTFARGAGLPGRVWELGRAVWMADVLEEDLPRDPAARSAGLHAAVAVPVGSGGETGGVVELFSTEVRPEDAGLLSATEALGHQLGQFLLRRVAEAELADRARLEAQAAELNDEIVQGLALAHYHLQREEQALATAVVSATLEAAKKMVSDLLEGVEIEPGHLRRTTAARLPSDPAN